MAIIKKPTQNSGGEDAEKRNPALLLVGMQTGGATMKKGMEAPEKTEQRVAI